MDAGTVLAGIRKVALPEIPSESTNIQVTYKQTSEGHKLQTVILVLLAGPERLRTSQLPGD